MEGALYGLGICCRWSSDSSHLADFAVENGNPFLYLTDKFDDNPKILVSGADLGEGAFLALDFAPASQTLLFVYAPQGDGFLFENNQVYIARTDGRDLRTLTNRTDHGYNYPIWSPDGHQITFRDSAGKI